MSESCVICLGDLHKNNKTDLTCKHAFHTDCFMEYAQKRIVACLADSYNTPGIERIDVSCPLCREVVINIQLPPPRTIVVVSEDLRVEDADEPMTPRSIMSHNDMMMQKSMYACMSIWALLLIAWALFINMSPLTKPH